MPISFTPISYEDDWSGSSWTIDDEDNLSSLIAHIALGQSRSVEKILKETGSNFPNTLGSAITGARGLLTRKSAEDPYHRDGWLFQIISWIAARKQNTEAIIRAPHMNHAHKGLDGLIVEMSDNKVDYVVICEEKATENPRKKIIEQVWPEFEQFENGERDHELVEIVTSLIDRHNPEYCDEIIEKVLWDQQRAFRISVTGSSQHQTDKAKKALFKGYATTISGDPGKRRAEILIIDNLRDWMEKISQAALQKLDVEIQNV
ncbi:hypothetical protein [Cobetia sp. MC34]|uniref:hypothetical protein n=1 Tax=Cobetia sp. MC34 TaxID=2785080 RepID=UPI001BCA2EB1|nr:hypothetical protein [Cobetia sp. MC34]MBS4153040.1 hypothetical protein [Cobetia sp. MC34]